VAATSSAVKLSHNWILSNTASLGYKGNGGGTYFFEVTATLDGDVLLANVATFDAAWTQNGDGIYHSRHAFTMTNGIVARSGFAGGAGNGEGLLLLGLQPLNVTLVNSTIVSNTDGGIECVGSEMTGTLANLILWGNEDDLDCSTLDLAYSDVEDTGDTGPGVIHQDPLFVDAADDDYHLQAGSPCIDAGATPLTYTFVPGDDWDGDLRPGGNGYDMGADEHWYRVYLPLVLRDY
jgi:hypothetical protein